MSTDKPVPGELEKPVSFLPYDQFILFGDSITEFSCNQEQGFGFHPALQNGKYECRVSATPCFSPVVLFFLSMTVHAILTSIFFLILNMCPKAKFPKKPTADAWMLSIGGSGN